MFVSSTTNVTAADPARARFHDDVVKGLARRPKRLPCKYFYDRRGCKLFDAICRLDEYYLTRTELAIMQRYAPQMAARIGPGTMLVELGSGSGSKTCLLLDHLPEPAAYVPVDICGQQLQATADRLGDDYPHIDVMPVCADFTAEVALPTPRRTPSHRTVYFPGSTIGNFPPAAARRLLARIAAICGHGGGLLVGIDLRKNPEIIEAAYNDRAGVTAAFNLNLLRRVNRELDADFNLSAFRHHAFYDRQRHRMDIRLMSLCEQRVRVGGQSFWLACGEPIHTEYSYKYAIRGFARLAEWAGFALRDRWTDPQHYFGVLYLERTVDTK
jgi:dimethylhistidine N-methyltransferase